MHTQRLQSDNQLMQLENRLKRLRYEENRANQKIKSTKSQTLKFLKARKSHDYDVQVKKEHQEFMEQVRRSNNQKFWDQKVMHKKLVDDIKLFKQEHNQSVRNRLNAEYSSGLQTINEINL